MNVQLIGNLIRLRYKLMWARTRTRNGKIAVFVAGYLLLVMVAATLAAGGIGAGITAVRAGKAEAIAQGVLTALFGVALVTSVMLGFGVNAAFTDTELRRYPLRAAERKFARHFTGAVDPFWFLFVMLELGLAFGLWGFGAGSFPLGVIAVLLLFVCNYLAAQVVSTFLERLMQMKGGTIILPVLLVAFCFLPGAPEPKHQRNPAAVKAVARVLEYSPTFGAGALMTRTDSAALYGCGVVAAWIAGLAALLGYLERLPPPVRREQAARIRWDDRFLRVGAFFGPRYGPLVTHWLQFYFRCRRFRVQYLISLPLLPFLLLMWTRQPPKGDPFAGSVGVFAIAGLAPAAAFLINQFGYVGSGFRRYFLFPGNPAAALRASSYALLTLCAGLLAFVTAAWVIFPPTPYDARGLVMLVSSGLVGLFLFHGLGLWTTLYGPRRSDPFRTMGNDLSVAGNVVVVGGMLTLLMGPRIVGRVWKGAITPDRWWALVVLAILSAVFYFASLRQAERLLLLRREKLLAIVEGKA